jgi:hypothetical protein
LYLICLLSRTNNSFRFQKGCTEWWKSLVFPLYPGYRYLCTNSTNLFARNI